MDWSTILILFLGGQVLLLLLGLPVAIAFFAINLVGAFVFMGGYVGELQLIRNSVDAITSFALSPIPLFVLMGEILFHTGVAQRAIDAVDRLISRVPGRLSLVAVVGGTIFAALSGSTMANTALLGSTLMPEMRRRGYHYTMAMGPILGTGGIAMLIPPSALAVLLASLGNIPVADLLIAGILPGLLMAAFFFGYVVLRCLLDPKLAPVYDAAPLSWRARLKPVLVDVVPLLSLFVIVVGSILGGIASPTESAALGAVGAFVATVGYRACTWRAMKRAALETAKMAAMIFFIVAASITFSQILSFSGATDGLLREVKALELPPTALVVAMLAILLFLGCFMDQVSMMMITLPFFMPLAQLAHIDLIWFGILMLILLEIGFTTPPFGLLLFVMKGVAPPDTTMKQICLAAAPFIGLEIATVAMIFVAPQIATWLPSFLH
jgi:tripartite ATP-independent transporter DctM subunit